MKKTDIRDVDVRLGREDFFYYNWVQAFERPIVPFLIYTFTALVLTSMLGIFPWAQVYGFAALIPMLGYFFWLWLSNHLLWRATHQSIKQPRHYSFYETSYKLRVEGKNYENSYQDIAKVIESRQAFYLFRADGSADIITKKALLEAKNELEGFKQFLSSKVSRLQRSGFL